MCPHGRDVALVLALSLLIAPAALVHGRPVDRAGGPSVQPRPAAPVVTVFTVDVPHEDAILTVNGTIVPGAGMTRRVETPRLPRGSAQAYTFTVEWNPNSYTTMTRHQSVSFRAGDPVTVKLNVDSPDDRVRVIFVPTPSDVADAMAALAGVTSRDVIYEPGCGDARITIAGVKRGARRAICVDIDPARVEESRTKVREAGLQDRIDVRLGDALDVKDLSEVTVVFLYMGDHFDLLIRPVLWRELPVGARIVSHRFGMGDWAPDKTETINSDEGGVFELHLWTITEALKRRMAARLRLAGGATR